MQNIFQLSSYVATFITLDSTNTNKVEESKHSNIRFSDQQFWSYTKHLKIGMSLQKNSSQHCDCGTGSCQFLWLLRQQTIATLLSLWVSEYVTPQQEAWVSHQIPQEARKFFKLAVQQFRLNNTFITFCRLHFLPIF